MYMRSMIQKWIPELTDYLEDKKEEVGDAVYLHIYKCLKEDYDFIKTTEHFEEGFKKYPPTKESPMDFVEIYCEQLDLQSEQPLEVGFRKHIDLFLWDTEDRVIRLEQLKKTIDIMLQPELEASISVIDNKLEVTYNSLTGKDYFLI